MTEKAQFPSEEVNFKYSTETGMVSIVIVCHNDADLLRDLIPDIESQSYDHIEIICVLNGSDASSKEYLSERNVRVVDPGKNLWYSGGNNRGVEFAKGEYVLILNPDTRLESDSVEQLVETANRMSDVAVFVPKVLSLNGETIDSIGKSVSKGGWFACIGGGEPDNGQYDSPSYISAFDGAAFLIRRCVIQDLGLFDQKFNHYQETNDLSLRIFRTEWEMMTVPDSIVYHEGGGSFTKPSDRSHLIHYYGPRNDLLTVAKNYNLMYELITIPIHVLWPLRSVCSLIAKGNFRKAFAKIRGMIAGLILLFSQSTRGMSFRDQISLLKDYPKDVNRGTGSKPSANK